MSAALLEGHHRAQINQPSRVGHNSDTETGLPQALLDDQTIGKLEDSKYCGRYPHRLCCRWRFLIIGRLNQAEAPWLGRRRRRAGARIALAQKLLADLLADDYLGAGYCLACTARA